jgi:hypothetical protein
MWHEWRRDVRTRFVDKLSRRLLGRSKHRWEDGIIIKEWGGVEDWINLALGRCVHVVGC